MAIRRYENPIFGFDIMSKTEVIAKDKAIAADIKHKLSTPEVIITRSDISLYSWEDMKKMADGIYVTNSKNEGLESVWDPRMGSVTEKDQCTHCGLFDCPGHYGLIDFRTLVYNPVFIRDILSIIRCVCHDCSKLLISEEIINAKGFNKLAYQSRLRALEKECVDLVCLECGGENPIYIGEGSNAAAVKGNRGNTQTIEEGEEDFTQDEFNMDKEKERQLIKNLAALKRRGLGTKGVIRKKMYSKGNEPTDNNGKKKKDPGIIIPIAEIYKILDNISLDDARLLGFSESVNFMIYRFCRTIVTDLIYDIFPLNKANKKRLEKFNTNPETLATKLKKIIGDRNIVYNIESNIMKIIYPKLTTVIDNLIKVMAGDKISNPLYNEFGEIFVGLAKEESIITLKEAPRIIRANIRRILEKLKPIIDDLFNDFSAQMPDLLQGTEFTEEQYQDIYNLIFNINIFDAGLDTEIRRKIVKLTGMVKYSHPRDLVLKGILVTPRATRQPMYRNGVNYPDSLTTLYISIMRRLINMEKEKTKVKNEVVVGSSYNIAAFYLYIAVKNLIFGYKRDKNYFPPNPNKLDPLSIFERIQGKEALIRHSMMGKIVSYCGRTVAGPDPSVKFGQIRIPEAWKRALTKSITVTNFNILRLQTLLKNDKIINITDRETGIKRRYLSNSKYRLRIGDKVDRELRNGDRIVVNRQPTLHRQSMMKYEVVLGKQKTIGLHLSYTSPMNADFDGDEINGWDPQDFEVEAEADIIMDVKNNIMSAEQNRPIMGLVMNSISAAFLLSQSNVIIDDNLFNELLAFISNKNNLIDLKSRLRKWGIHPYSGAALFSAMLPNHFYYRQKGIFIVDGVLISGRLKKASVGASHRSIIQDLYNNFGVNETVDFFTDAPWILNKWIMERGFSVGLLDMLNLGINENNQEYDKNLEVLKRELTNIYVQFEALGSSTTDPLEESFRIKQITNLSNIANGIGIRLADNVLSKNNSIGIMTEKGAGTKGAVANIGQMLGAVGQQFYQGERLKATLTNNTRLLPTYDPNDNDPRAHAFIANSFFTGLTEDELFLLQAGGRENLLDTALKTQDTGSMQHKMIKAFENIVIGYDGSVRNSVGSLFMTVYNSGYDVGEMMMVDYPGKTDFSSFIDIKSLAEELNFKHGWIPQNVNSIIKDNKKKNNKIDNINLPNGVIKTEEIINYPVITNKMNKFEKSRVIAARAQQLANDAFPLIDIENETDMVRIAEEEFDAGLLDFIEIIRKYPNGKSV